MEFIKKQWLSLILGVLLIFFIFKDGCSKPENKTPDTVVTTTDTVRTQIVQPVIHVTISNPNSTSSTRPIVIPPAYQPSNNNDELRKQFEDVVREYLTENRYQDSLTLKDSAGNRVGVFNYNDLVRKNKIESRQPSYQLSLPVTTITNTTTITKYPEPVRQVYIGGEVTGSQYSPINGVNLGVVYKDRSDRIFTLKGGLINLGNQVTWQAGIGRYWKINLRKK